MEKLLGHCLGLLIFVAMVSSSVWAHGNGGRRGRGNRPCAPIYKACSAAKEAEKTTQDPKECVAAIKGGGKVEGVTITDTDLTACQGGGYQ